MPNPETFLQPKPGRWALIFYLSVSPREQLAGDSVEPRRGQKREPEHNDKGHGGSRIMTLPGSLGCRGQAPESPFPL